MDRDLKALIDQAHASAEGFGNKDVSAWMDPIHEDAIAYNPNFAALGLPLLPGGFLEVNHVRPMADQMIHAYNSFTLHNLDGRVVNDTAVLFGEYVTEMADGTKESGACTFACVRVNGEWKTLLNHYTPQTQ